MKSYRNIIEITTDNFQEIINITSKVSQSITDSGISDGLALVYSMHTSSGVYISDSDTSLTDDFLDVLKKLVPAGAGYRHDEVDYKKNADGHLKTLISSHHVVVPVTDSRLDLGTYQTIYYAEFDGTRKKRILVKIIGC